MQIWEQNKPNEAADEKPFNQHKKKFITWYSLAQNNSRS
jgi:hypothetical protein